MGVCGPETTAQPKKNWAPVVNGLTHAGRPKLGRPRGQGKDVKLLQGVQKVVARLVARVSLPSYTRTWAFAFTGFPVSLGSVAPQELSFIDSEHGTCILAYRS